MAHGPDHAPGATHAPTPNDPEHDIDAKSTTIWFVGGGVTLFVGLWLLVVVFLRVVEAERKGKIEEAPTTELYDVKASEKEFLDGGNPKKKKIDDVVASMRRK